MEKTLISKKRIRLFIRIILAPVLSKLALLTYLVSFLLIINLLDNTGDENLRSLQKSQNKRLVEAIDSIKKLDDFKTFFADFFVPKILKEVTYGASINTPIRILQYPIKIPEYCTDLKSPSASSSDYFRTFSSECVPLEPLNLPESIPVTNSSLCFSLDCEEYSISYDAYTNLFTTLRKYNPYTFHVDLDIGQLNKTDSITISEKLDNWIQKGQNKGLLTIMINLEFCQMGKNNEAFYYYRIFIECISPDGPCKQTLKLYPVPIPLTHEITWDFLSTLCLISITFMFLKALIDYHYLNDRVTMAGMMVFFLINVTYITVIVGEKGQFEETVVKFENSDRTEYPMEKENYLFIYTTIRKSLQPLCIFFFGFRILLLISYQNYWRAPIELMLLFYRLIPGIAIITLHFFVLTVAWSTSIFSVLSYSVKEFSSLGSSILYFLYGDLHSFSSSQFYKTQLIGVDNSIFPLVGLTILIMRTLLFAVILSGIMYCIELAFRHVFISACPDDSIRQAYLASLSQKIDKFAKENLPQLLNKSQTSSRPIVIWLDKKSLNSQQYQEIFENSRQKNAKITLFDDWVEIIDFLKYLFRIKPGLLVRSDRWFRIVLESTSESFVPQERLNHVTNLRN